MLYIYLYVFEAKDSKYATKICTKKFFSKGGGGNNFSSEYTPLNVLEFLSISG